MTDTWAGKGWGDEWEPRQKPSGQASTTEAEDECKALAAALIREALLLTADEVEQRKAPIRDAYARWHPDLKRTELDTKFERWWAGNEKKK